MVTACGRGERRKYMFLFICSRKKQEIKRRKSNRRRCISMSMTEGEVWGKLNWYILLWYIRYREEIIIYIMVLNYFHFKKGVEWERKGAISRYMKHTSWLLNSILGIICVTAYQIMSVLWLSSLNGRWSIAHQSKTVAAAEASGHKHRIFPLAPPWSRLSEH